MMMSARARLVGSVLLAAVAATVWTFVSRLGQEPAQEASNLDSTPVATVQPVSTPAPVPPGPARATPKENGLPAPHPTGNVANASALHERMLVGTKWERGGFGFEFGADGKLVIGGRERAQWRVEGSRIRLYRETTGEEHWLDIRSNKLMWEGQEIGRVP